MTTRTRWMLLLLVVVVLFVIVGLIFQQSLSRFDANLYATMTAVSR